MRRQELKPLIYWVSAAIAAAGLIYSVETYNRDVLTAPHSPNLTTRNVVPYARGLVFLRRHSAHQSFHSDYRSQIVAEPSD